MSSTNLNDIIVIDVEKFPKVGEWGIQVGTHLGLEVYHLADEFYKYIPQDVTYLRFPSKEGVLGEKYWGEIRHEKSTYGVNEEGTTNKEKEVIPDTTFSEYVIPFMKKVMTMSVQEIFEHMHVDGIFCVETFAFPSNSVRVRRYANWKHGVSILRIVPAFNALAVPKAKFPSSNVKMVLGAYIHTSTESLVFIKFPNV